MSMRRWARQGLAVAATALALGGCGSTVINPVTGQSERSVMDEASEIAEGKKAHAQVLQEYQALADPQLQAYVDALGQGLAKQSHRAQLVWHFTVLDSPEVNAFALPGGYVYVTRGIMAYLDSEADLAGVIGHEIGHVTARHGAQRATRQQTAGFGVLAASVLGMVLESQGVGGATELLGQASQNAAAGYIASYSREQELQADALGAEYLARSHYRPQNMVDVIAVLKQQEQFAADEAKAEGRKPSAQNSWLASHPSNDQRLAQIREIAAQYRADAASYKSDGAERYLKAIDGMAFGESAEQGLSRGNNFYHTGLGIAINAPAGWKIRNSPEALNLLNPAGDAALVLRPIPSQAGGTHEEIVRRLLKPEQGQLEKLSLNGLPASHFTGVVRNAQGQRQPVELTLVDGPKQQQYALQYLARDAAALARSRPQMTEAQASLRALTAADRKAARPWLLRTQAFPAGGFAQLAKSSPLGAHAEAQLRLLNGALNSEPKTGQRVKVVLAAP